MASGFQRRKVAAVFEAMDAAGRGHLVEGDFEALAQRWTTQRGVLPGSARHALLNRVMLGWWASLSSHAANTAVVTLDDVMTVVDLLPTMPEAVDATAEAMFEAVDENADGRISRPEYRALIEAWNGRSTDTDLVFSRLDLDGDGYLSRDEFRRLWSEFWAGDDPDAPGTWVFGEPAAV